MRKHKEEKELDTEIEKLAQIEIEELYDNVDKPEAHNIALGMNRPPMHLDPAYRKATHNLEEMNSVEEEAWNKLQSKQVNKHPLLNDDSEHYKYLDGRESIELMEAMFTRDELVAWAKLNAMKYRLRIGLKDNPEKEMKKIKTYEAYYKYLVSQN